ncbi:MAG TPA: tail fiber domain-containing protein, partial [Candidatus Paceibacterota bacterium]|nr:tail fiber domain-containing protein [Candidatus Paceibacterota bacterium]
TTADAIAIGSALDSFALTSTGLSVTSGGALTGVTSIDTIAHSATAITFEGVGTLTSGGSTSLTVDSHSTGALNLGTSNDAKTINLGTGTAGNTINIGTNNTIADTISIGSALDALALSSTGLNLTTGGALTGVASVDTIAFSATAMTFAGAGALSSTGANALTLDSGTTGALNLGTGANAKAITIGNATGATDVTINAGTGGVDIGANAIAKLVQVGTTTGASRLNLGAGTGGVFLNGLAAAASGNLVVCINNTSKQLYVGSSNTVCNSSSARFKHSIEDIPLGLAAVKQMRPVSFEYNETNERALGFIAEEVANIDERLIIRDEGGLPYAINPDYFIPIITKGVQELSNKLELFLTNSGISMDGLNQLALNGGLRVSGEVDLGKDSVGEAVIRSGATEISVVFTTAYTQMPVVTITKMTQGILTDNYIDEVSRTGFKIKIAPAQQKDMRFSWHAFGSTNGIRLFSDGNVEDVNSTSILLNQTENTNNQSITTGGDIHLPDTVIGTEVGTSTTATTTPEEATTTTESTNVPILIEEPPITTPQTETPESDPLITESGQPSDPVETIAP